MQKIALVIVAVTFSGCASTREESAIAFQEQLPQLVADCNMAFRDGTQFGLGVVAVSEGVDACDRLAHERSLSLANPAAVKSYQSYRVSRTRSNGLCPPGSGSTCPNLQGSHTQALQQQPKWPDPPPGLVAAPPN